MLLGALRETAKQALRAGDIIRHLREFVTRGETEKRPEDIKNLIEEAGALALVGSRERGIRTTFEFAPQTDVVFADRVQIQQVLTNLMRNAMEAMKDSDRRELRVRTLPQVDHRLTVEVSDTGPGVAPAERGPTLSTGPSSQAMEPPPAPIASMAVTGIISGKSPTLPS